MWSRPSTLPAQWKEFLLELDSMLTPAVDLHCIGGFALCFFYGLPRSTGDIDYYTSVPTDLNLEELAGQGSPLATEYKVWLHRVTINNMAEQYASRLTEMLPGQFKSLRLHVPDPYDCILSKLERNSAKDREDVEYLFRTCELNFETLQDRYTAELRPYLMNEDRHDLTMKLWEDNYRSDRRLT